MNKDEILIKLQDIFRDIFDNEELIIQEDMTSDDIDEWDSLTQISLVCALEDDFDTKFTLEQLQKLKNVKNIVDIVLQNKK